MNIGAYGGQGHQAGLTQGLARQHGVDSAALHHDQQVESARPGAVPQAVVVELGRGSAPAATYAPPVARAEATGALSNGANGAAAKLGAKAGQADTGAGPWVASDIASSQPNVPANTTVAGGSIVVMDVAKMKSSVRVDVVAAAASGTPASAPPVAPVLVAKVGTFSSLDAFAAVQPMQPKALTQADRHQDTEEAGNDTLETDHAVDPRWRKYQEILDARKSR